MIRIMILEDQQTSREALKKMILSAGEQNQIVVDAASSFSMAKKLLESDKNYDAFFLDINLDATKDDDKSGMEFAKHIRSYRQYEFTPVVMVTSMANLEMDSYRQLHCYQYIVKPYIERDVISVIKKLLSLHNTHEEKSILVKKDGINYRIKTNSIVYIQAVPRGVCLYMKKDVMKIPYLTIVKLMEQLDDEDFIQCHRMFVINKKYIENVDFVNRMIKLEHYDELIELGGTYKHSLKEKLSQ